MIKHNRILLKIAMGVLSLLVCVSCNPYASRRIPLGNYPYMACKKTGVKRSAQSQKDDSCDFVSEEAQKEIKPLPLQKRKIHKRKAKPHRKRARIHKKKVRTKSTSNKKIYIKPEKKSSSMHGDVKTQDLSKTAQGSSRKLPSVMKSKKKRKYVALSDSPKKEYSTDQQQKMLVDKKTDMQKLSDKSQQVVDPNMQTHTLETAQMPAAPTQTGKIQLGKKLQELQAQSTVAQPQQQIPAQPQQQAQTQQSQQATQPQQQTVVQPQQQVLTQQQQANVQPQKQRPKTTAKSKKQTADDARKLLDELQGGDSSSVPTYNMENKPIPLPDQ